MLVQNLFNWTFLINHNLRIGFVTIWCNLYHHATFHIQILGRFTSWQNYISGDNLIYIFFKTKKCNFVMTGTCKRYAHSPSGGLQRDAVYLGWPISPSYMSPDSGGGGGEGVAGSQPMSTVTEFLDPVFAIQAQNTSFQSLKTSVLGLFLRKLVL